jgi:hypothetical protein
MRKIACFISPHGFGHATRMTAVLESLQHLLPDLHPLIFTSVPRHLFSESLSVFTYHPFVVDIGLVQNSALSPDLPATIKTLDAFLPYRKELVAELTTLCMGCSLVLCDIAPLGIVVAKHLGIASVLIENFTWDWIYAHTSINNPALEKHALYFRNLNRLVTHRIQTEPLCQRVAHDLLCGPIFRRCRGARANIRQQLDCGEKKLILVTMGGAPENLPNLKLLQKHPDLLLVFTGQRRSVRVNSHVLLLQSDSGMYHPDLVSAADLVVCKTGYSTLAECCQVGARVIAVGRENFPETKPLQDYLQNVLGGMAITPEAYTNGAWLTTALELMAKPRSAPAQENGADKVADFLNLLL